MKYIFGIGAVIVLMGAAVFAWYSTRIPLAYRLIDKDDPSYPTNIAVYTPEEWPIEINTDLLRTNPSKLKLPLPSGSYYVAEKNKFKILSNDHYMWSGIIAAGGSVKITMHEGRLSGIISRTITEGEHGNISIKTLDFYQIILREDVYLLVKKKNDGIILSLL